MGMKGTQNAKKRILKLKEDDFFAKSAGIFDVISGFFPDSFNKVVISLWVCFGPGAYYIFIPFCDPNSTVSITGEIESCDFEPADGATLETLDKHWQNYYRKSNFSFMMDSQILHMLNNRAKEHVCIRFG